MGTTPHTTERNKTRLLEEVKKGWNIAQIDPVADAFKSFDLLLKLSTSRLSLQAVRYA